MTRNKGMDNSIGQMEDAIKEVGKTANKMGKVLTKTQLERKGKGYGATEKR